MLYLIAKERGFFMFNRAELKNVAKERLTGNWSYMAGITLLLMILTSLSSFLGLIPVVGTIFLYCIISPITLSQIIMSAKLYHREHVEVGDIFSGFTYFGKCVGLYFWMLLWIFLWTLLLIVPGIIKGYSYSLAFYCLRNDPSLTIREALQESIRLTDGYKAELFVLELSWMGWSMLALFTCGIGMLFLTPYMGVTHYAAFRFIKEEKDGLIEPITESES